MPIKIETTEISGVHVITPDVFQDQRGFFLESFREDTFRQHGLPAAFVQDNHSGSVKGVLRGLHFQWDPPMAKLMRVTRGTAFLVAVDIRKGSPTLGQWFGVEASAENRIQVFAPAGFARGFCVLSEYAEVQYKCTGLYNSRCESGIRWNDPQIGIRWPVSEPIISKKDELAQSLAEWLARPESDAFPYAGSQM
jgi:dTDP-4-dehydrorhamnose 3,5-epimerase